MRVWTGFIWLGIGPVAESNEHVVDLVP